MIRERKGHITSIVSQDIRKKMPTLFVRHLVTERDDIDHMEKAINIGKTILRVMLVKAAAENKRLSSIFFYLLDSVTATIIIDIGLDRSHRPQR